MNKILTSLFLLFCLHLNASNYNGEVMPFKQPDGSFVDLKLFGSEYYMRAEGLDNYSLIRDPETKWICYAKLSADGNTLLSTGIQYKGKKNDQSTLRNDLNLPLHMQINLDARHKVIKENQNLLGVSEEEGNNKTGPTQNITLGTPIFHPAPSILGLTIVVDFSDEQGTVPINEFTDFCNDLNYSNYGNNGSLRKYYWDLSGGLLDYQNVVYGYFRAPHTFAYYDALPYAQGAKEILGLALNWIASTGFDFSTLTLNTNNSIMAINLMYTGNPPVWSQGMWHHKGSYTGFNWNGIHSDAYNCSPANGPLTIATLCHENGHMVCKWPDTYKYDQSEDGIGAFDLMCATGNPTNPVLPNPLFRSNAGWGDVIDVSTYVGMNYDTANSGICYMYNPNNSSEFFLFEHRQKTGRNTFMPDEGLTIWHINRNGNQQSLQQEVYLDHANNSISNHNGAAYRQPFSTEFSVNTNPSSDWNGGFPSGLMIWGIDTPSAGILPYHIGPGTGSSDLHLNYINLSGDNNGNSFLEAGESADLNVEATNTGFLYSSATTLSCTPTGPNAGLATVNSGPVSMGTIGQLQPYPAFVNISVDPSTPVGTVIDFNFLLTDNIDTAITTASLKVGYQISMNNQIETVCNALFYDQGIENNYYNNTTFTKTIKTSVAGNKIFANFLNFDLETDSICGADYLQIYNGPNTSSPLIGTYCGTNSPGAIHSTDSTGSLTFKFHANTSVTAPGWYAIISCAPNVGVNEINKNDILVYPNPTTGQFYIRAANAGKLKVTDAFGKTVFISNDRNLSNLTIDLTNESDGIYIVEYEAMNSKLYKKIVKVTK